jgi:hypothetical protein
VGKVTRAVDKGMASLVRGSVEGDGIVLMVRELRGPVGGMDG